MLKTALMWTLTAALVLAVPMHASGRGALCEPAMLVFDASGSMRATRIVQARAATAKVLPRLTTDREVGLVTYGGTVETIGCESVRIRHLPEVANARAILADIEAIEPSGRTPLADAVEAAARVLERSAAGLIVLVTDGEENCGGDPCALGRRLAALAPGLKIHVIGFRLRIPEGSPLACLAEANGGRYVEVNDTERLGDALGRSLGCAPVAELRSPAIRITTALDAATSTGR